MLACLCLPEEFLNCRVVVAIVFTSQSREHYQKKYRNKTEKSFKMKRCRNGMPKSTPTRKDIHVKVKVNIQSLIHPYIVKM